MTREPAALLLHHFFLNHFLLWTTGKDDTSRKFLRLKERCCKFTITRSFNVIYPLIELTCSEHNMHEALNQQRIDQIELEKSLMEKEGNEDDDEYVLENRNAFEHFLRMNLWIVSNLETENSFKPIVFIQ